MPRVMGAEIEQQGTAATRAGLSVRHRVIEGFMGADFTKRALRFVTDHVDEFRSSEVTKPDEQRAYDSNMRRSWVLDRPMGELRDQFEAAIHAARPGLFRQLGVPALDDPVLDISVSMHRDGDYFRLHQDVASGKMRRHAKEDRIVSTVYYFHAEPRAFEGGGLKLYSPFGRGEHTTIVPASDSLVAFQSFVPHEVEPVSLPGDNPAEARFSINCWICRARS